MKEILYVGCMLCIICYSCKKEPQSSKATTPDLYLPDTFLTSYKLLDSFYRLSSSYIDSNGVRQPFSKTTVLALTGNATLLRIRDSISDTILVFGQTFVPFKYNQRGDTFDSYICRYLRHRRGSVGYLFFQKDTITFQVLNLMKTYQEFFSIQAVRRKHIGNKN